MKTFQKGKLSVIVPCYNVEEFIRECLNSLVNQTYKNIEVIMVDDGSPDNTGTILDEYDKKYTNFHAIHTENGGLSAARNAGLPYITGEYMAFVDSDDVVLENAYELLIGSLMQTGSEMASGFVQRFNSHRVYSSGLHKKAIPETILKTNINESTFLVYDTTAWNKVYKSELFLNNNLRFPVGLTYEDIPVSMQLHLLAKSVDVIAEPVYLWRVRESSNQSITQKRESLKLFNDRTKTVKMAQDAIEKLGGSAELKEAFNFKVLDLDIAMYLNSFQSANEETLFKFQKAVYKFLRDYNLDDIKKLDVRKQIQYYSLLEGNFKDFKRYGYQWNDIGKIKLYDKRNYEYKNDLISESVCESISVDNAILFQQAITSVRNIKEQVIIRGTLKLKSRATLPKISKSIKAFLVNEQTKLEIPIDFKLIWKRTKKSFFLKKAPTSFQIFFNIENAREKIGLGTWKIRIELAEKNIFIKDYLKNPKKMRKMIFLPFESQTFLLTNNFNRRWELLFNVKSKQNNFVINNNRIKDIHMKNGEIIATAFIKSNILNPKFNFVTKENNIFPSLEKAIEGNSNGYIEYLLKWKITTLLSDTVVKGKIIVNDGSTNARLNYSFQSAKKIQTIFEKSDLRMKLNYQQNEISIMLVKVKLIVDKIKIDNSGLVHLSFQKPENENIDLNDVTLTLGSTNEKNSYKNFATVHMNESGNYVASFNLFDKNKKALILSNTYNIYLDEKSKKRRRHYIVMTNQMESKDLGQIIRPLFIAKIGVTANGLMVIKMKQKWTKIDGTRIRRAFNYSLLYPLMRLLPLESKTVMFESLWGAYLNDNPKSIYDYWKKNYPNYKFVWSFKDLATPDEAGIVAVRKFSFKYWYYLARAKYFIENTNFPNQYAKRKGQIEVQTLHGTFMKTMGFDEPQFRKGSAKTQRNFMKRNARWDYLISPSEYMDEIATHAFDYHKEILQVGFPRNDILINKNKKPYIDKLKKKMGLPDNKKIILYAPTFRQNGVVDLELDIEKLQKSLSKDYVLLVRLHYLVANAIDLHQFSGFAIDMSAYESIEELYLVSDVLITDYSSVMFDYGYLQRPMIFFTYDLNWYLDSHNRGVYLDYVHTVPGPVLKTTNQIVNQLLHFDELKMRYHDQLIDFYNRFCLYGRDGKAAEHTVQTLLNNKPLAYKQDYERNLLSTKFTHFLGLTDLKLDLFNYFGQHTTRRNIVIFESFKGDSYSDSPRAVYEYMKQNKPEYKLIWNINRTQKDYFDKHHIPYVVRDGYRGILTKVRAKYWFTNSQMEKNWKKPHGMKLIQTSKGTPLKKVGADVMTDFIPGQTITKYQQGQVYDARKWDYLVTGNEYGTKILQNAYRKETRQMIKSGLPKNDRLLNIDEKKKIQITHDLNISQKCKVVLYAPTWRDDEVLNVDKYMASLRLNIDQVIKALPKDTLLLVRFHSIVAANRPDISQYGQNVIDVTDYADVTDILAITNILITDYSSLIFDFMNLKRPIILFADDVERYAQQTRGMYIDYYKDLPGFFASTTDEVVGYLVELLKTPKLPDNFMKLYKKYCSWENGSSTRELLEFVFNEKKYLIKQTKSNLIGEKVFIDDGAQMWSKVYIGSRTHLIQNIDKQSKNYVVEKVAGLTDPIRGESTGRLFAELKIENVKGWIALKDLSLKE